LPRERDIRLTVALVSIICSRRNTHASIHTVPDQPTENITADLRMRLSAIHVRTGMVGTMKLRILLAISAFVLSSSSSMAIAAQNDTSQCRPAGPLVQVPGLSEASGLAVSRRTPGRLWTHNDSGEPVVVALDARGSVTGRVRLTGAAVEDWEAITVGPCGTSSCLHVGDIGDNEARRKRITVYRLPEPDGASGSAAVTDVFHATYPDGPHDAEALLIGGDGRIHIVTKGETGPVAIYRFPAQLKSGATVTLERVGSGAGKADAEFRITDGAVSPDGQWAALRTKSAVTFYRASDLLAGQWRAANRVDLTSLREAQGEGVALGADNTVFLVSEGGGKGQAGSFARFSCAPRG
jgi:hypothetical protein